MEWKKETPQRDGFYWLRREGEEDTVVKIRDTEEGLVVFGATVAFIGTDSDMSLCVIIERYDCKWLGPLEKMSKKTQNSVAKIINIEKEDLIKILNEYYGVDGYQIRSQIEGGRPGPLPITERIVLDHYGIVGKDKK